MSVPPATSPPMAVPRAAWHEAAGWSARAHAGQCRKDGSTPYAAHPARVALTIAIHFGITDETILTAAYLHDIIEDTGADYDDVLEGFGEPVADLVAALTKDMRLVEPVREEAYDAQLAEAPWGARLIKLADVYDNLGDVTDKHAGTKLIGKAERALALAAGDDRLAAASACVRARMDAVREAGAAGPCPEAGP